MLWYKSVTILMSVVISARTRKTADENRHTPTKQYTHTHRHSQTCGNVHVSVGNIANIVSQRENQFCHFVLRRPIVLKAADDG